ncbi:hypothetical protein OEA66_12605 [Chryseobacterium sp. KC 927]|uniref:Lipoprotein n=2 Tax=Chryseobacterium luquanense TaxID=2983766 RepID=A0ABT3Y4X3_9FLAO|nr:hypothetical protein [Chryseobacterium luquanense]
MVLLVMWRKIFNFFIIAIVICCFVRCKETKSASIVQSSRVSSYDSLVQIYTKEKVYVATYFTNRCFKNTFDNYKKNSQYNYCNLQQYLNNYMDSNTHKPCAINNIKEISRWCSIDAQLNEIPIQSDEGVTFEEIIYNMDIGKNFYSKYLKDKNQYYGSLDFQQSCALYYDVVSYLYDLDYTSYKNFMKKYLDYYQKHQEL